MSQSGSRADQQVPPTSSIDFLSSLLNQTLHVHTTDSRLFVGQLKCTDNERNIILNMTHEYRQPSQSDINLAATRHALRLARDARAANAAGSSSDAKFKVDMKKRFLGLVVVPGTCITKIQVEGPA